MDRSAVLHWLRDVKSAYSGEKTNGSDGGSLSPNYSRYGSLSPLDEQPTQHNQSHHQHHHHPTQSFKQHESASLASHYSSSNPAHVPSPSTNPLVPSSSFKVPENPSLSKPPDSVKKFLRSNTLTSGYVYHRKDKRLGHFGSDSAQDTGSKPAGLRRDSWEPITSPVKRQQGFPPHKARHQKNLSWSPVPESSPEPIQPTVDLSSERVFPPKRKILLRTKLELCQLSVTTSAQQSCSNDASGTSQSVATTRVDSSLSSPPKSAPVSPNFKSSQNLSSSLANDARCLSHNNLADFNSANKISDISHSTNCMVGKSSVDGQSHLADRGEFSDISSSDGEQNMTYNSGRSSSMDGDLVDSVRDSSEEAKEGKSVPMMELVFEEIHVDKPGNRDLELGKAENSSHGSSQKASSSLEGDLDKEEEGGKGEVERPSSCEEELLQILKKWYKQGYGEKDDLVRAMMLTGHQKSAHNLLQEENKEEEDDSKQDKDDDGSSINPTRPGTEVKKDPDLLNVTNSVASHSATSISLVERQMAQSDPSPTSSTPPPSKTQLPFEAIAPPMKTTPPLVKTMPLTSPPESRSSPCPPAPELPLSITLLPLSRKKLAELDKVTCFTFDDSNDDILDAKSSAIPSKKSNSLSSKTHSWSLSDYNSSVTSSSSRSSHVMSPGYRTGSPMVSKSSDSFEHKKWPPLHRGCSVFTVPEESKDTCQDEGKDPNPEENQHHDRLFGKSEERSSEVLATRLKFSSLGKPPSFFYDSCPLPQEKNLSRKVYKRQ